MIGRLEKTVCGYAQKNVADTKIIIAAHECLQKKT